jgi:hypothetical protein
MKGAGRGVLFSAAAVWMWAGGVIADEHGQPPTVHVPNLSGRIQIDGRLSEPVWGQAATCEGFISLDGKSPASQPTSVRVFYGDAGLWFGFRCRQPNAPIVHFTGRDQDIYSDDSVEIFLDADCAGRRYHHFVINAAGVVRDDLGMDPQWNGAWESATVPTPDGWSCEVFIPFATVGLNSPGAMPLGMNLCRNDAARKESSSWAGLAGLFHQPDAFGLAMLGKAASKVSIPRPPQVRPSKNGLECSIVLTVRNDGAETLPAVIKVIPTEPQARPVSKAVQISGSGSWNGALTASFGTPGRHALLVLVEAAGGIAACTRTRLEFSAMQGQSFGYPVAENSQAAIWWCEGTYKVGRDRPPPTGEARPVRVEAARNEYEPIQVVVRPHQSLAEVMAKIDGLVDEEVTAEVCLEHYVKVETPTDAFGSRDWYPDALPPLTASVNMEANRNQPVWITFYVSPKAKAGDHPCKLILTANGTPFGEVPVTVHVFDFTLPAETHTETAYGMHIDRTWHGPLSPVQHRDVWIKYLTDMVRHRIACYTPTGGAGIDVKIVDAEKGQVDLDFREYDKAATYCYDRLKISAFNFPYGAVPGKIDKFPRGSEGYDRLHRAIQGEITRHLAEKGWLKRCYAYWVDEPPPSDYAKVKEGMDLLHRNCPGLRTLLTCNHDKAPVPYFFNAVDVWVPLLSLYDHQRARERQKLGERVWWYVCCAPRHPYPNNFIDHPAINHRIRFWAMEKYGVDGSLYWSTTYWTYKNPWEDPMSYNRPDKKGTWGNGDGYLLYPPVRQPSTTPVLDEPVNSIRLELLREGLEDREYFWLLKQRLGGKDHPALHLPDRLVRGLADFETDPQKLLAARRELAEAIEKTPEATGR